jgi:hypothetical protein
VDLMIYVKRKFQSLGKPLLGHFHEASSVSGRAVTSSRHMPCRPRVDPLSSALAASQASARFWHDDILGQGIHVHVGLMPARFTRCDHYPHAICAHVCQRHRPEGFAHSRRTCLAGLSSRGPT